MCARARSRREFVSRAEFPKHYRRSFYDPNFAGEEDAIARLEEIAWKNYKDARKSPVTAKAGPGFADPDYDLSVEWRATRDALLKAEELQKDPATPSRVLVICASSRNDGSCPGEMSKSFRCPRSPTKFWRARPSRWTCSISAA